MLPERRGTHLRLVADRTEVDDALDMARLHAANLAQVLGHRWDEHGLPDEAIGPLLVPLAQACRRWLDEAARRARVS